MLHLANPWHNASVTQDEAIAEAARLQRQHPDAKWIAMQRQGEWLVARIGLEPIRPTGTAVQPPPVPPRDALQSELQRITTKFGIGG
jgi:hypothetical protein